MVPDRKGRNMQTTQKYNGYTNYETWALCLSPDLLAACEKALAEFKGWEYGADAGIIDSLEAAIAKARGDA